MEENKEQNTYFKQLICDNCGKYQGGYITNGVLISDYCRMTECSNCGCRKLRTLSLEEQRDY